MIYSNPDTEAPLEAATLGREHRGQVVLVPRLRATLEHLNPGLPAEALDLAIQELVWQL